MLSAARGVAARRSRRWAGSPSRHTSQLPALDARQAGALAAIGALAGTCGSLIGLGGGFVMLPLLVSRAAFTQHQAHAMSLGATALVGGSGAYAFARDDCVDAPAAGAMTVAAMIMAPLGTRFASRLPQAALKRVLGVFMLCMAPLVPLKDDIIAAARRLAGSSDRPEPADNDPDRRPWALLVATGTGTGFLSGLLGIGGGAIMGPVLAVSTDFPHQRVLGTSLAAMVLPAVVGSVANHRMGKLCVRSLAPLGAGSAVGAYLGGRLAVRLPERELRWGFGLFLTYSGMSMLRRLR